MSVPPTEAQAQPATTQPLTSSPIRMSSQGSRPFTSYQIKAEEMQKLLAEEMTNHWVGPMPVEEFLKEFLPFKPEELMGKPVLPPDYFNQLQKNIPERMMYDPFIQLIEAANILPGFKILNSSNYADQLSPPGMKTKPDISVYRTESSTVNQTKPTSWMELDLMFEVKPDSAPVDPFNDEKGGPFEVETSMTRKRCRGQLVSYARVWNAHSHRTHCFMVYIGDPYARIIRFDRTGAVVSQTFNFRTKGNLLAEFLWRVSKASPEMLGRDPTVRPATTAEEAKARKELDPWKGNGAPGSSVLKMTIPHGDPTADEKKKGCQEMHELLVWVALADPESATGRATRGYPAWDLTSKAVVFVKDSWRSLDPLVEKETDILRTLNAAKVINVPTLLWGDDLGQKTKTKSYVDETWNIGAKGHHLSERSHIRFAEDFVGVPLSKYESSQQLVQTIFDALLAHQDAYKKCKILHRDISAGNILMKKGGGGILNDWDLARKVPVESGPRQPFRSGTWQFMSAALLADPGKQHTVSDDLEAFFWVLLYNTLRYNPNHIAQMDSDPVVRGRELRKLLVRIFDDFWPKGASGASGGDVKEGIMLAWGVLPSDFEVANNEPLTTTIAEIRETLRDWYFFFRERVPGKIRDLVKKERIDKATATQRYLESEEYKLARDQLELFKHDKMIDIIRSQLAVDLEEDPSNQAHPHAKWPKNDKSEDAFAATPVRKLDLSPGGAAAPPPKRPKLEGGLNSVNEDNVEEEEDSSEDDPNDKDYGPREVTSSTGGPSRQSRRIAGLPAPR